MSEGEAYFSSDYAARAVNLFDEKYGADQSRAGPRCKNRERFFTRESCKGRVLSLGAVKSQPS